MPVGLGGHGMVNYGPDLVVIGGVESESETRSGSFYRLSCKNGKFKWKQMKIELKVPRSHFVAMTIPIVDVGSSDT